ncbi:serine hydrolase [Flavihumibacter rivuli]|uniref:serine hydrolase n=1 Tax=Flavihumibacter rivuli TaxID=2838156 RepID=UPI001BDE0C47|nr:serine hydrolase [Flavihumibacter rivuli]ULQ55548.1 serine hydrolase [Flavihumibacter rivuli]
MFKRLTLSLSMLLVVGFSHFASAQPSFIKDSLDTYVTRAMQQWQIPGVSIAVIKGDSVWVMKGYGVLEQGGNQKVNEHTRFGIGSNTKAFTGTAMAMLETDKKLSLDDKVQKWVPDFTMYDPWVAKEAMVRDLLSHRLGFETFQGDFMYFDSDLTYKQVKEKFGKLKPMYGLRSKWGYTNAAFAVAGEVIEKASGQSWASFLDSRIFKPLGMYNTLAVTNQIDTARNTAKAHTIVEGKLKKVPYGRLDNMAPAGNIFSSAYDMSRWAKALLNDGELDGKKIIDPAAIASTRLPHSIMGNNQHPFNRTHFALYGLGWFLNDYEGKLLVEHTGGVNGFVTAVTLVPEEKIGIIVLTNTDYNGFFEAMKAELLDACLGLPYRNYNGFAMNMQEEGETRRAKTLKERRDTVAMKIPMAASMDAFAGIYQHDVYGKMTISKENDKLIARFEYHKGRYATLEPMGGNRMLASFNDPLYGVRVWPFTIENGKVKSVTMTVSSFIEFTPYEFIRQ